MQIGIDKPCMYMYMKTNKKPKRKPRCNHDNAPRDVIERTAEVFFFRKSFQLGNTFDSKSRDRKLTKTK